MNYARPKQRCCMKDCKETRYQDYFVCLVHLKEFMEASFLKSLAWG